MNMMKRLIPLAIAIAVTVPASRADASYVNYCGGLVNPRTWCWSGYFSSPITWNRARYPGSACIGVGIVLYRPFSGTFHDNHSGCRYIASSNLGMKGYGLVSNNSSNARHTVEGMVDICWGCQPALRGPEAVTASAEVIAPALDQLAMLRRPAGKRDVLSPNLISGLLDSGSDVDAASARRADLIGRNDSWYVVPGEDVCLFRETEGGASMLGTCAPAEGLDRGELYVVSRNTDDLAEGMARISGVVPDGVHAVRVQLVVDGPIVELPVTDNVYVGELADAGSGAPASIELVRDDGSTEEPAVDSGGCQAGGSRGGLATLGLLALGALFVTRRRRR